MNLTQFTADYRLRNAWLREPNMSVYVRRSVRILGNNRDIVPCLDLASVEVDESKRGTGILTKFLRRFEAEAKSLKRAVYVESIQEPRLREFLLKNGYTLTGRDNDIAVNMFKIMT